jgi:hypothetical protein
MISRHTAAPKRLRASLLVASAWVAVATALVAAACGSTSTTSVGPSPVKCEVSLAGPPQVAAGAGTGTITVTTQRECSWTASSDATWISGLTPSKGQGSGTINFTVAANPVPSGREGDIIVNDTHVLVRQDFSPCTFAVGPPATTVPSTATSRTVTVTTVAGCTWTSTTNATWLTLAGANGNGSGSVTVQAAANTGAARTGSVIIAGETIVVSQSAVGSGSCTYSIQPTTSAAPASGGPGSASITSAAGCAWSATSDVPWISITAGIAGNGNGTVAYTVGTNTTASARTGRLTVEGATLTVNQSAGSTSCDYSINPASRSVGATASSVATSVAVSTGCVWTAVSNTSWLTIASGASGNGNGSVNVDVAANDTPARSGTLTIAGRVFTVNQSGGCTFGINPNQLTVDPDGGTSSVAVTAGAGCGWNTTVSAQAPWITVTSGGSGSGNGTVNFSVAKSTGPPRSGTMTVAGQTFTVNQVTGCAYSIAPNSQPIGAAGGTGTTTVTAGSGCGWNVASNDSWITISTGSGTGSGPVNFTVGANSGPARTGTLTVAGQPFTVNQASGCTFAITPTSQSVAASGGGVGTAVATGDGCAWSTSISAQAPWLTLSSSGAGSGNGTVSFNAAANSGPQRSGTATVAGQTFTVVQADGCTFAINPNAQSFGISGGSGSSSVTAGAGCTWTATSHDAFITVQSGSGNGNGTATFNVASNSGPQRTGTLTIAGQTFTVTQAAGCTFTINPNPPSISVASGSSSSSASVSAPAGCGWTASSNSPGFLTITAGASGSGNGQVNFNIAANSGPERSGTLTIAGQTFTVNQASGCTFSFTPNSVSVGIGATSSSTSITASAGTCQWTVTNNAPSFITITSGGSGTGNGTTNFNIAANPGPQRTGTLTIGPQTFTVNQASGCAYTINPTSLTIGNGNGSSATQVMTNAACPWTATNNAPSFLQITSGGSGTGNGTVNFNIIANTGPQRVGTIAVADKTLTITQVSGCTYSISPMSQSFPFTGGIGTITVTTAAGCTWTAAPGINPNSFISVTSPSGGNGTGPGTVQFTVGPLITGSRTGTITITGTSGTSFTATFTVTQN